MSARSSAPVADGPAIDIVVQSPLWAAEPKAKTILRRAIASAARGRTTLHDEVAVVLTDDAAIQKLNREWRGFDKPTNVLSFPTQDRRAAAPAGPALLGDIVISYDTTAREARAQSKPFAHHLAHLAVHGFLHLLGYDHDSDTAAWEMEQLEARILATLDVPDPYVLRDTGA